MSPKDTGAASVSPPTSLSSAASVGLVGPDDSGKPFDSDPSDFTAVGSGGGAAGFAEGSTFFSVTAKDFSIASISRFTSA